jgi:hypothetical protein
VAVLRGEFSGNSQGQLLRPAQDCLRRYGYGVHMQEITQLTPTAYQEQTVWSDLAPDINAQWRAIHHLDYHKGMMVMDAQRLLPMAEAVV